MTAHRTFKPHNPLADRLNDPRGMDALSANRAAAQAIKRCEPEGVAEIRRALAMMAKDLDAAQSPGDLVAFPLARVYAGADAIAGLAALFDRPRLGEAASSLCKLLTEERGSRPDAIKVHVEALLIISKDDKLGHVLLPGLHQLNDAHCAALPPVEASTRRLALSQNPLPAQPYE